jgi:hypothetical protein
MANQLAGWSSVETWAPIRISVKGDAAQTARALADRGLQGVLVAEANDRSFWDVPEGVRPVLTAWFCEPAVCGEGGFPAGTLLFHG